MKPASLQFAIFAIVGFLAGGWTARAQSQRFPISEISVAQVLTAAGVDVSAAEVSLPGSITASVTAPRLEIRGAELAGTPGVARVNLRCASAYECVPFDVVVTLRDPSRAGKAVSILRSSSSASQPIKQVGSPVLRAGEHTVLLMENKHMRITLPVISIDTGGIGTEVRVASLDRKQLFHGVIADGGIVRGALP